VRAAGSYRSSAGHQEGALSGRLALYTARALENCCWSPRDGASLSTLSSDLIHVSELVSRATVVARQIKRRIALPCGSLQ
jgi:hypothetical protein